jgi:hypothetical protein
VLAARAKELQLSDEYTALFVHVSRILPDEIVNGPDTDPLRRHYSLANNVDPVVITGVINAPTKTGETTTTHKPPPKEPRLATSNNRQVYFPIINQVLCT